MWKSEIFEQSDFYDMLNLIKENYGDIEIAKEEFLRWQYEKNPAGSAVIQLAKDKERDILAGQYVIIPMKLKFQDKVVKGTLSLNTLTKSEYRGQGIFTKLASDIFQYCSENKLAFTYGFPNPNSYPGFIKKLSFQDLGSVPLLLRPLNLNKLVRSKTNKYISSLIPNISYFMTTKKYNMEKYVIYEINESNINDINQLWDDVKDKHEIIGVRDAEYIKWRYIDIPLRKYKIFAIKDEKKILGYIIGNCKEVDGVNSGMIVDFLLNSNSSLVGDILVNTIIEYFKTKDIDLIGSLMLGHTLEYKTLKNNKFYKCPKKFEPQAFPVVYREHTKVGNNQFASKLENWFLTMGDYDVI